MREPVSKHNIQRFLRGAVPVLLVCAAVLALAQKPAGQRRIKPQIVPGKTVPTGNRVLLERANELFKNERDSFLIVQGNVKFIKGGMVMYCDSAQFYPESESFNAFGNVRMEQGDTLFIDADELRYDGVREDARLYADFPNVVRMRNRDVKLVTDAFYYDLRTGIGSYDSWGELTDPHNVLTSTAGEYSTQDKDAIFTWNVHLTSRRPNDTLYITTEDLYYNTVTHMAEMYSDGRIVNRRGTIYTSEAIYNTATDYAELYNRSRVVTPQGRFLTADTIYYDRASGLARAYGDMFLEDTVRKVDLRADTGWYNELTDSAFATGRALVREYSKGDTLYMHGRYIEAFTVVDTVDLRAAAAAEEDDGEAEPEEAEPEVTAVTDSTDNVTQLSMAEITESGDAVHAGVLQIPALRYDTTHVAVLYPRVRFYRSDMQGLCDSMRFTERDSMLRMYGHPLVWSEDRQISGREIHLHLADSTVDRAFIPERAFVAQHIEDIHYNQLSGKELKAFFENCDLRRLEMDGSVELLLYPEETDSTINKVVTAQSSYLTADFVSRQPQYIRMWPEITGVVTPLFLARRENFFLSRFKWYEGLRPRNAADVMVIPPEMDRLMEEPEDK